MQDEGTNGPIQSLDLMQCNMISDACTSSVLQEHQVLLSELKQLYVLITRARHCVLFFESPDSCKDATQPILDFWRTHELIKVSQLTQMVGLLLGRTHTRDVTHNPYKLLMIRSLFLSVTSFALVRS